MSAVKGPQSTLWSFDAQQNWLCY